MMLSSRLTHSSRSPISKVPYDVLQEIFIHCLPRHPLEIRQPNTTIAPMLLCHICSSWRTVALTSPTLWSHLSYHVDLLFPPEDLDWLTIRVLQNEIDFILWWKEKQGLIAPFLRIDATYGDTSQLSPLHLLAEDGVTTLLKYLMSAQYLQIDRFWELFQHKIESGCRFTFSDLHTVVVSNPDELEGDFSSTQVLIGLVPSHPPSALRRLSVYGSSIYNDDYPPSTYDVPTHWVVLTHLSLCNVYFSLKFWFSLIRAVPDLQWACIDFGGGYDVKDFIKPAQHVIPQLSTLFVGLAPDSGSDFVLASLFSGLQLPALHTLSISCKWMDRQHIPEIYTILQSTPILTTLAFRGYDFYDEAIYFAETAGVAIEPIWSYTPQLRNVQLELPNFSNFLGETTKEIDDFVCNAFFSDICWLSLDAPKCPIRTITLLDMVPSNPEFNTIKHLMMSGIQKRVRGASNVTFQIVPQSEDVSVPEMWKEWGSRN